MVAHDHDGIVGIDADDRSQRLGPALHHTLGPRESGRDCIRGAMIVERHFPAEPHREIHDRHRIGTRTEQQQTRRRLEHQRKDAPSRFIGQPAASSPRARRVRSAA